MVSLITIWGLNRPKEIVEKLGIQCAEGKLMEKGELGKEQNTIINTWKCQG